MDDRRAHYRFEVPVPATFSLDGRIERPLRVVNISRGGLLGEVPGPIAVPRRARVRIEMDGTAFEIDAVCLRADYDPPYRAAFYFLDPGGDNLDRLQACLSKRVDNDGH